MRSSLEIAPMREADLDEVIAIEERAYHSPWTREIFREELGREWAYLEVARELGRDGPGRVVGYCNYWLVRDEVHLLNLAVHPAERRRGYGRRILEHLLEFARQKGCRYVTLEVRRSNQAAIELYSSFGFGPVGVRPNYYVEDREDALVMLLEVSQMAS